jgi:hypothetical protein
MCICVCKFFEKFAIKKKTKNSKKIKNSKFSKRSKIEIFDIGMERKVMEADFWFVP